jgi:outer membrane protein TolC
MLPLLASAVLALATGVAAPLAAPTAPPDSALANLLAGLPGEPLALEDAVRLAQDGNLALRDARAVLRSARGALRREKGAFDPVLFADWERAGAQTPTSSPFSGADVLETDTRSVTAGARLKLPLGTELAAVLETIRLETNSAFAALDPEHSTQGRLEVRQPLLRGFGPAANVGKASASRELEAAAARASDAAWAVAAEVEAAYWDVHAMERELAVRRLLVERGRVFVEQTTKRAAAGLAGPGEVATAKLFLAEQELQALVADEQLDGASDRLGTLVGRRPQGEARYRALTPPPPRFPVEEEGVLLARALEDNEELRAAQADLAAAEARARAAGWDRLPRLDVSGSIGGGGLAGTAREVAFLDTTLVIDESGGFSESFDEVRARDFPTWSVGLSLEVPLGLREGRGERERLVGEAERARARVEATTRSIQDRVRARRREVAHGTARLELARTGVDAALEQARIGEIEYRNGRTTAFELVRLGADVAAAQQRYSDALVRTAKAAAELARLAPGEHPHGSEER